MNSITTIKRNQMTKSYYMSHLILIVVLEMGPNLYCIQRYFVQIDSCQNSLFRVLI